MPRWPSSLRARLTAWYAVIVGVPLVAVAVGSYLVFARTLVARTDHFIGDALGAFSRELVAERRLEPTTVAAIRTTVDEVRFRDLRIAVLDTASRVVALGTPEGSAGEPDSLARLDVDRMAALVRQHGALPMAATLAGPDGGYRIHARAVSVDGIPFRVAGAYPLHDTHDILQRVRGAFLIAIPLLLAAGAAGGYFLAKRSLSPVSAMGARAAEITATNLHERLPVVMPHDELGGLATVVNDLLDRLERAFAQQQRFMADASHELRTPTAILRTEAEVTLSRPHRTEAEYRESIGVMQDAAHRLSRIVNDLFLLARADAGHLALRRDEVYLDEVVHGVTRAVRQIADQRDVQVELVSVVDAPVRGDADLLDRLLLNLLDNAIKYSARGARVEVALTRSDGRYEISVVDTGPGIPAEAQGQIFERFFRVDAARSRVEASATSGAGLGLPIARRIAEAHGGRLELVGSRPGRTEFRISLPAG